ncbi:MAG TPA: hypothetical protein ENO24_10310, partial [Chloroflexi bacterium]|nr:hypothetical protein [Chloroflexota bacterium]
MGSVPWPLTDQVLRQLATAGGIVIVVALIARLGFLFVERAAGWITGRTKTELDDLVISAVRTPLFVVVILLGARAGLAQLTFLDAAWTRAFEGLIFVGFVLSGYMLLHRLVGNVVGWYLGGLMADGAIDRQLILFLRRMTQVVLLSIALIMILD